MKRALAVALLVAALLRFGPLIAAWISPRVRARAKVIGRRLDVASAVLMIGWTGALLWQRAWVEGAIVGAVAVPVVWAGVAALRGR